MVVVPAAIAVTTPEEAPMVATAVLLAAHVPPPEASDRVTESPWQTAGSPVIAAGKGSTVTVVAAVHPVGKE